MTLVKLAQILPVARLAPIDITKVHQIIYVINVDRDAKLAIMKMLV